MISDLRSLCTKNVPLVIIKILGRKWFYGSLDHIAHLANDWKLMLSLKYIFKLQINRNMVVKTVLTTPTKLMPLMMLLKTNQNMNFLENH